MARFDGEAFVAACLAALEEADPLGAVAEAVAEAVAVPDALAGTVELPLDPDDDGLLYRSPELVVARVLFPAKFVTGIHDHRIPAVIGAWAGYEDNLIYRREGVRLVGHGKRRLEPRDVLVLEAADLHDVHAPTGSWTGALHVYLGDLEATERSSWAAVDAPEQPFDGEAMERQWTELGQATGLVAPG